ncbi:anti-sigma factor [Neobacillus notoginsengisoli]|uniref:Anti-sigma-W factor RsiW n=1 Tax=Neobacillus notoginsengisoli TaxID=1578198 RepID=A0A417YMX3_9BACI|nr:anti-sigma factor [Neobacillus notoginsengisoli]RHW34805.1 anti-sigma factor [Neobacillus notoginsengisoli]
MNCPEEMIVYMHEYLDDDLEPENERVLREHLGKCEDCQALFHEMNKTVALIQSTANVHAPENFTASVIAKLPKEKKKISFQRWMKQHPMIVAAAVFMVLMAGSLFSAWESDRDFSTTNADQVVIENDTVIVPAGKVVKGDLVVKNGDIKIEGEVQGNVTVINGENYLASAGNVTGKIEEVDKAFDWIWYNIKKTTIDLFSLDGKKGNDEK